MLRNRINDTYERIEFQSQFKDMLLNCLIAGLLKPGDKIPEKILINEIHKNNKSSKEKNFLLPSELYVEINGNLFVTCDTNAIGLSIYEYLDRKLYQFFRKEILPSQTIIEFLSNGKFNLAECINSIFFVFPGGYSKR